MKKQITQLVDDLDGSVIEQGGETIRFSLEGRSYEIDLSAANAERMRDAFAPYIRAGRGVGGSSRSGRSRSRGGSANMCSSPTKFSRSSGKKRPSAL